MTRHQGNGLMPLRYLWLAIGWLSMALAAAGALLPLLPTTPFLLVALYAFARSSPQLHGWLMHHPQFGPLIENWQCHGAIPRSAKQAAAVMMLSSLGLSWWVQLSPDLYTLQSLILILVAAFILTRPDGNARHEARKQ